MTRCLVRATVGAGLAMAVTALPLSAHPGSLPHLHAGELAGLAFVVLALALLPRGRRSHPSLKKE